MAQTFRFQPGCCGCGCTSNHICVNINLCCGETLSGSTLTLTQGACVTIPTSGTYTVTCSRSGYVSDVRTVVLGCGNYNLVVNLDFCVNGLVQGCNGNDLSYSHPVSGASVVIKLTTAGTTVYSTTTGADGRFCTHLPSPAPDSYTATVTASRYDTLVQVLSPGSHDPHANTGYTGPIVYWTNFYMQPTAGYTCCPTCTEPIPDTLHATLVIGGTTVAVTLVRSQGLLGLTPTATVWRRSRAFPCRSLWASTAWTAEHLAQAPGVGYMLTTQPKSTIPSGLETLLFTPLNFTTIALVTVRVILRALIVAINLLEFFRLFQAVVTRVHTVLSEFFRSRFL
jgi:hypothetical protein